MKRIFDVQKFYAISVLYFIVILAAGIFLTKFKMKEVTGPTKGLAIM